MEKSKLLRYSIQLSMLKHLLHIKKISEKEYQLLQKELMKEYKIVSNITA